MNETPLSSFEAGSSDQGVGSKLWSFAQKVLGPLLVGFVTFLAIDRDSAWTAIDTVVHDLEIRAVEGKRRHELIDRDHELIDRDFEELKREIDGLADRVSNCQLQMQQVLIEMARLPPEKWQKQIMQNEHDITVLKNQ